MRSNSSKYLDFIILVAALLYASLFVLERAKDAHRFYPGLELPTGTVGEPYNPADVIEICVLRDGTLYFQGEKTDFDKLKEQLKSELARLDPKYEHLAKLFPEITLSLRYAPVVVLLDRDATWSQFQKVLDKLCSSDAVNWNVGLLNSGKRTKMQICGNLGYSFFWRDKVIQQCAYVFDVRVNEEYELSYLLLQWPIRETETGKMRISLVFLEEMSSTKRQKGLRNLKKDIITTASKEKVSVDIGIKGATKWQAVVNLLAILDRLPIVGYVFRAPEIPY